MRTIKLFAAFREMAGASTLDVPLADNTETTVHDLVGAIQDVCPQLAEKLVNAEGQLTKLAYIFIDGRSIRVLDGLDTPIAADAQIAIFPPTAGG